MDVMYLSGVSRGGKFQGRAGVADAIPHRAMTKLGDWSDEGPRLDGHWQLTEWSRSRPSLAAAVK